MLYRKNLCCKHFSESDSTTAERVHLSGFAVPYGTDSMAQSLPQPPYPSIRNTSIDPLPSGLTLECDLNVLVPTRTYSKTLVPSAFKICAIQSSPTAANAFAVKETFLLGSEKIYASDGALGHISRQCSPSKPRARRSMLKELNLASLSDLTPNKRILYELIRNKESAFCKLKK
jgi:hypothetical protein